jgi:hypothetical protein
MESIDIVLIVLIVSGALYLLYHSLWKKKGHCSGECCGSGCCGTKRK